MALITQAEVHSIVAALTATGLDLVEGRRTFIQGIDSRYIGVLPTGLGGTGQIIADLSQMNNVERLTTGEVPLQIYLTNASFLVAGQAAEVVILQILDTITHKTSGAPRVVPQQPAIILQRVIHRDDMVSFAFMAAGLKAGASVLKLRVPGYQNSQRRKKAGGEDVIFLGTGWLITPSLMVTNHHVVNARQEGEQPAAEADLRLQATNMVGDFDFDADGMQPSETNFTSLEAWDATLDYAVVRMNATQRQAFSLNKTAVTVGSDPIPVNIIQHPNGKSKRYGIRNNLLHHADGRVLNYFTDTEGGSSGSPVCNDRWEVVGLHRGSSYVTGVQFQGKPTAYINMGTQITAIITDLKARYAALATECGL